MSLYPSDTTFPLNNLFPDGMGPTKPDIPVGVIISNGSQLGANSNPTIGILRTSNKIKISTRMDK